MITHVCAQAVAYLQRGMCCGSDCDSLFKNLTVSLTKREAHRSRTATKVQRTTVTLVHLRLCMYVRVTTHTCKYVYSQADGCARRIGAGPQKQSFAFSFPTTGRRNTTTPGIAAYHNTAPFYRDFFFSIFSSFSPLAAFRLGAHSHIQMQTAMKMVGARVIYLSSNNLFNEP